MKNKAIGYLQNKAKRSLEVAKDLHKQGNYDFATSRAYYAMFYIAEALLLMKEKQFSKHAALISAFYQSYVESGLLQRKYHAYLQQAYALREEADYAWDHLPTKGVSQRIIENSEAFMKETERFFKE